MSEDQEGGMPVRQDVTAGGDASAATGDLDTDSQPAGMSGTDARRSQGV